MLLSGNVKTNRDEKLKKPVENKTKHKTGKSTKHK